MTPTNDFLPFATDPSANVESQAAYATDSQRSLGQQPGVARSNINNKALRQATYMVSCLAQYMANTTGNDVLDDATQSEILATMALTWPQNSLPTQTKLTTTGTAAGYLFTVSSANASVGATYTNNGNTYTVLSTLASGTLLFCSGASAPTSTGTLTKSTGTGDSTITFSVATPLGLYTVPANVKYLSIEMVGAGGGGGGTSGSGGAGSMTAFGAALLECFGGGGGAGGGTGGAGGAGGAASLGTGPIGLAFTGAYGGGTTLNGSGASFSSAGASGGCSAFGGAGAGVVNGAGIAAAANSGSGGGGGSASTGPADAGGGAGGYLKAMITTVAASYYYCVGVGGTAGSGTNGGGAGAAGIINITEHYSG